MKELFKGFYTPGVNEIKKAWENENTLFVFDTNVLLNLYSYTEKTRNDFFQIIEKLSSRIWLPYHVGLEYQRNRLNVIKNEKGIFNNIHEYLANLENNITTNKLQGLKLNQRLPELHEKTEKIKDDINKLIAEYKKEVAKWNKKQPDVRSSDEIRKKIDNIFSNKIGIPPKDQEWLNSIYKEGEKRYKLNVPPGYKDKKDKEDKDNFLYADLEYIPMYGDLIIWKQVMEKAVSEEINAVIFITDDVKEDWWYILDSNGKKEIGARAELREEIHRNSKISTFELLRTTDFMKNGQEYLSLSVSEESITETKTNFENTRIKYNRKIDKEAIDQWINIKRLLKTDFADEIKDTYKSNIFDSYWDRSKLFDKQNEINNLIHDTKGFSQPINEDYQKLVIGKLKEFEQQRKDDSLKSLLEKLNDAEEMSEKIKYEEILKKLKKLDDDGKDEN